MAIGSLNLSAEFFTRNVDTANLHGEFVVKQWQEDLLAGFIVLQWLENIPTRLRTMRIYDLRGTTGIGFHWQGAANPPESIVDFIVESPTGFWVASFYDGPAEFREVFIPWRDFRETGIDGTRPDKSQVDGFVWIVHTDGLRRVDYIYARPFGNLPAAFDVRQPVDPDIFVGSWGIRYAGWEPDKSGSYADGAIPLSDLIAEGVSEPLIGSYGDRE